MIAVALFIEQDSLFNIRYGGLFRNGGFALLGAQLLSIIVIVLWSSLATYFVLRMISKWIPIRIDRQSEARGLDLSMNNISAEFDLDSILSTVDPTTGVNPQIQRKSRKRIRYVIQAVIAMNRFLQTVPRRFRPEAKHFNTKVLSQSWSAIAPVQSEVEILSSTHYKRPRYVEPHQWIDWFQETTKILSGTVEREGKLFFTWQTNLSIIIHFQSLALVKLFS